MTRGPSKKGGDANGTLRDIGVSNCTGVVSADQTTMGLRFPPQQQILLYSGAQWEEFVEEWAHFCLKPIYVSVRRFTGAGDRGVDVAGFTDADGLQGVWDNYQCKHLDKPLAPSKAWVELGKILWHSFKGDYRAPRAYFFVAARGVGTTLAALLADSAKLRKELVANWDGYCRKGITDTQEIDLEGAFLAYVEAFDFSIFGMKTSLQLIEDHRRCPHHAMRFGGGLPERAPPATPPDDIGSAESRYVEQLFAAYGDHTKAAVSDIAALKPWPHLQSHFGRQRVAFYHAESLRIFARESVPPGTFESLQEDIYTGVIDTHDAGHSDGYQRVCAVTKAARDLQITSNPLITRSKPTDRDGICHQLANENRLLWKRP
jgi:hypothetical protein